MQIQEPVFHHYSGVTSLSINGYSHALLQPPVFTSFNYKFNISYSSIRLANFLELSGSEYKFSIQNILISVHANLMCKAPILVFFTRISANKTNKVLTKHIHITVCEF